MNIKYFLSFRIILRIIWEINGLILNLTLPYEQHRDGAQWMLQFSQVIYRHIIVFCLCVFLFLCVYRDFYIELVNMDFAFQVAMAAKLEKGGGRWVD